MPRKVRQENTGQRGIQRSTYLQILTLRGNRYKELCATSEPNIDKETGATQKRVSYKTMSSVLC